jgi:hypothetical protein
MRNICLALSLALPALVEGQSAGAKIEPAFAGVQGVFFALSVADAEASAKRYAEKLGLAVEMRTKSDKIAVVVLSGSGLVVELLQHDDAIALGKDAVLTHGFVKAGLVVENLDKTLAVLKSRNVQIAYGPCPARATAMSNFIIKDNAGNLIQFFGK